MDRSDLQVLAEARVVDAEALLQGGRFGPRRITCSATLLNVP